MNNFRTLILAIGATSLAACATPYTSPVEVTRFVAEDTSGLGSGTISTKVESSEGQLFGLSQYGTAVETELGQLGYTVNPSISGNHFADIKIDKAPISSGGGRSPVSVGVGGSTGSYGSGVGLGLGINLGGGQKPREITTMSVRIADRQSGETLWEGRAELVTSEDAALADPAANAAILARALFRDFPGGNGETVSVKASELQAAN